MPNFSGSLANSIVLENDDSIIIENEIIAPVGEPAVDIVGDDASLQVTQNGSILAPDAGNTAVRVEGEDAQIDNRGTIAGDFNGVSSTGDDLNFINRGTISSNSRAVDITDGDGSSVENFGEIIGTGDQRNGTLYVDGSVDELEIDNRGPGIIDAGEGNLGDGISVQVGIASEDAENEDIDIINRGVVQGRGQAAFEPGVGRLAANGSSGIRYFNGSGEDEATITGSLDNFGEITTEVNVGFLGGVVIEDGVAFEGRIRNFGSIEGPRNGLYVGNAEHDLTIGNRGNIESGSRAVNLDGDNVTLVNQGNILGTGDQRNGTVYIDGTGDEQTIRNTSSGIIDAGEGNLGDGISVQVGSAAEDALNEEIEIINAGLIQGRGQAGFEPGVGRTASNGSSGVRFFNGSGEEEATVTGSLVNQGTITTEVNVGFLGGIVVEDGVAFEGNINNPGLISGPRNGLYIGNADHDLTINNTGSIESGSRAVNLDGDNVTLNNRGEILGTGDQRNGTIYIDGTGDEQTIRNTSSGIIDAGEGNLGDGISVQVGSAAEDALNEDIEIVNLGLIQGRGQAGFEPGVGRTASNGSSGVRFFNGSGEDEAIVTGSLVNRGTITTEVNVGFLGGIVVEDGVAFEGEIENTGLISGPRNGLYIGNADHDLTIANFDRIESGSRAVNLDGDNVSLDNAGDIVGTGDQRNGTVYIDGTGDRQTITNRQPGTIDAGEGNSGSGISVQVGSASEDALNEEIEIVNAGLVQGRGDGNVPAGVRFFNGSGEPVAVVEANITNDGTIASEEAAGILIEAGVEFQGSIVNEGTIRGGNGLAVDATGASGDIDLLNDGILEGAVRLGNGDDRFVQTGSQGVDVDGGSGDDTLTGGHSSDVFRFGTESGDDIITNFQTAGNGSSIDDILDLSTIGVFDSFDAVLGAASEVGDDLSIDLGFDNSVTLLGVELGDLATDNIIV